MDPNVNNRRVFLKTLAGLGISIFASQVFKVNKAVADTCDKAVPKNQMVGVLGYVPKSATKGQSCSNCIQFQGKPKDKLAKCNILQGCEVASVGWCKSWSKKS